jgi:hypothetical protein
MFGKKAARKGPPAPLDVRLPDLDKEVASHWVPPGAAGPTALAGSGPPQPPAPAAGPEPDLDFGPPADYLRTKDREPHARLRNWVVRFVLLGCGLVVLLPAVFILLSLFGISIRDNEGLGQQLVFSRPGGEVEEVLYTRGVQEEEARRLGRFLQEHGYFDGQSGKTVQLSRDGDGFTVAIVLRANVWNKAEVVEEMGRLGRALSLEEFAGRPVTVHLCDREVHLISGRASLHVRKVIPAGS